VAHYRHGLGDARHLWVFGSRHAHTTHRDAYAVWTGVEAVEAFVVGIVVLAGLLRWLRPPAAVLIVCGLALMKGGSGASTG
jgi:multidrug transporter EmrE-like cation transporter